MISSGEVIDRISTLNSELHDLIRRLEIANDAIFGAEPKEVTGTKTHEPPRDSFIMQMGNALAHAEILVSNLRQEVNRVAGFAEPNRVANAANTMARGSPDKY